MSVFYPVPANNMHLKKIIEFFGALEPAPSEFPPGMRFVFLCYTNRCGSNYVAEIIASSGDYNLAGEDLNFDTVLTHSRNQGFTTFQAYFTHLVKIKAKAGVFFLKTAPTHIELLGRSGLLDQIVASTNFILVERADKLAQAISFAIAMGTNKYTSRQTATKEAADVIFDKQMITNMLGGLAEAHRQFVLFFGRNGLIPEMLVYERVASQPAEAFAGLSNRLAIPALKVALDRVRLERQADSTNDAWRRQYLNEDR